MTLMAPLTPVASLFMVPSVPILSLVQMCSIFDQCIIIASNESSLSPLAPILPPRYWSLLVPSTFIGYFNLHQRHLIHHHWHQWIAIGTNFMIIRTNGTNGGKIQIVKSLLPKTVPHFMTILHINTPHFWGAWWLKRQKAQKSAKKASKRAKKRQKRQKALKNDLK